MEGDYFEKLSLVALKCLNFCCCFFFVFYIFVCMFSFSFRNRKRVNEGFFFLFLFPEDIVIPYLENL